MTAVPPHRPRGSGDGWVELPDGRRFWGLEGAAGLLAVSPTGSILLQHRVAWSHFGGTWGLPGGARALGESALDGAFREAHEESGIDAAQLSPRFASVLDLDVWTYTTVAADAPSELPVHVADAESTALTWVPAADVDALSLHPGFETAWPILRARLAERPALVVDVANVMGSRPDGWWRDRSGAALRLLDQLARIVTVGVRGDADGAPEPGRDPISRWWPEIVAVREGAARGPAVTGPIVVVDAPTDGDSAVVLQVESLVSAGRTAWAVTADRELGDRVRAAGGSVRSPGWLLDQLD